MLELDNPSDPCAADELERMLTASQIGKKWSLDASTITWLFENEPGVMVITNPRSRKRRYRTLRIPVSVAARVQRRLSMSSKAA
jgi:hypothetical protein